MGTAERRNRERAQRQNAILDAAEEVFAEKGVDGATIDDVARRAELSKGTIYLYFKSKEMLYMGISLRASRLLRQTFREAAERKETGLQKVIAIGVAYKKFCEDYPNYFRAMTLVDSIDTQQLESIKDEQLTKDVHDDAMGPNQVLIDAITAGHKDGTITRDADPILTAMMLWAQSNGIIQMQRNRGELFKAGGLNIDSLFDLFLGLIAGGLKPR